ncbi:hypothetical protein [Dendronalium sp. ChiSLP03b]|nr:hypothetical protein [Dendronalium sp. ChiSLP03b]
MGRQRRGEAVPHGGNPHEELPKGFPAFRRLSSALPTCSLKRVPAG